MNIKQAACEPCRRAKLACGHERPACIRCRNRAKEDACIYRERPFRRKKRVHQPPAKPLCENEAAANSPPQTPAIQLTSSFEDISRMAAQPHRYPNPGFLGTSSHSAIFDQVSTSAVPDGSSPNLHDSQLVVPLPTHMLQDNALVDRALQILNYLNQSDIPGINSLVKAWINAGVNLPLAEPFVLRCSEAVLSFRESPLVAASINHRSEDTLQLARSLLENTHKPIKLCRSSTISEYFQQLLGHNLRWESIGIFFTAASRAALDTSSFTPLYSNEEQRRLLIKTLTYISDCCLENCLALDFLNDLQLVLQYENFIVHSQVDGDQSYHSWRRMGDLISTLSALGYHERIDEETSDIPLFVAELRRAAFARIYAADKSLAIFLGRPPRLVKPYCCFQLPGNNIPGLWNDSNVITQQLPRRSFSLVNTESTLPQTINYMADTRSSALFASLKEDIIRVSRTRHIQNVVEDISVLRSKIQRQWEEFPAHFRLGTSLKDCHHGPFQRDFLVGARLDYLHTLFLLNLISQRKISEPDDSLLTVAGEILSLTVEAIILRDRLVNSGTSLIWKVAQYGLPAAGVISLALLNSSIRPDATSVSRSKMFQSLSALVTEITIGAWIQAGEPNFALFTQATRTIQSLLDSMIAWKPPTGPVDSPAIANSETVEDWDPYLNFQSGEFEMDFWTNLAEHPTLLN